VGRSGEEEEEEEEAEERGKFRNKLGRACSEHLMQNQKPKTKMLFPSHNARWLVGVSTSSAARVCGHSQLCDSSRHLLLRLLQRHPGAMAYLHSLAGKQQRSEATNQNLRLRGAPANGGDEVGADSHDGRSSPRCR
jgi:hypothetical protein